MSDIKEIYKQLTNVDIEQQKQLWNERGKGYYGEYLVFCALYKWVTGKCKILMNLNIPTTNKKTTEIDLLLIHETGLYVFEVKHFRGTIYGKNTDKTWTQYFRTSQNSIFKNPVEQNGYHITALQSIFPELPIKSVIVFTSDDCDIKVDNVNSSIDICALRDLEKIMSNRFQNADNILSMEKMDDIFNQLSVYSPMQKTVSIDKTEASFFSWVKPIIDGLEDKKAELACEKEILTLKEKEMKATKKRGVLVNIAVALLCVILSGVIVNGFNTKYNNKIQENNNEVLAFKQKFLHIDEIDNEYIDALDSYVDVSDVSLTPLTKDAVSFTAKLSVLTDVYGIRIQEDAKYIVMTDSGKTFEYNLFGENLYYRSNSNTLGKHYGTSRDLAKFQFYGISDTSKISYIKLVGVQLIKMDTNRTVIKDNLEIELYSK